MIIPHGVGFGGSVDLSDVRGENGTMGETCVVWCCDNPVSQKDERCSDCTVFFVWYALIEREGLDTIAPRQLAFDAYREGMQLIRDRWQEIEGVDDRRYFGTM